MTAKEDMTIDPETGKKYDYYKILGISEQEEDPTKIKRAYFSAAQKYHPDKNKDGTDTTTMFIYIQEAYTTLTSPYERAYYNRNRASILQTVDDEFDNVETFVNIAALRKPQLNFYATYDAAFATLSDEEQKAARIRTELDTTASAEILQRCYFRLYTPYPRFGDSSSSKTYVSQFYAQWGNFSTLKLFQYADQYTTKGENSRYRKLATGENEKFRASARKEFSDKVRELVAYVQRRDPRLLQFENQEAERARNREIQVKNEREAAKMQRQEAVNQLFYYKEYRRAELQEKLHYGTISQTELLEFESLAVKREKLDKSVQKVADELDKREVKAVEKKSLRIHDVCSDKALIEAGASVDANNILYCTVCLQRFTLIGEFKTHLNSKRHKRALKSSEDEKQQEQADAKIEEPAENAELSDDEIAYRKLQQELQQAKEEDERKPALPREKSQPKQKKRAEKSPAEEPDQPRCRKCGATFPSNSKLFEHLRSSGHAMVSK